MVVCLGVRVTGDVIVFSYLIWIKFGMKASKEVLNKRVLRFVRCYFDTVSDGIRI